MKALSIVATGMLAQQLNVEVISNNIANMTTTGYKRQRAEFQDLLYQDYRRVGSASSDTGTIVLAERDLASSSARQRNFGMVFQSYSLFPNMTVRKNIAYGLECRGWSRSSVVLPRPLPRSPAARRWCPPPR